MGLNATWKAALKAADGKPCPYCGHPMDANSDKMFPSRDHIHPRGARAAWDIIQQRITRFAIVCYRCNNEKGMMTLTEYRQWLIDNNRPMRAKWVSLFIAARDIEIERAQQKTPRDLRPAGLGNTSEYAPPSAMDHRMGSGDPGTGA